ncbi:MAG: acetyl-CoA synthetase [Candidatus Aminicenantes bacterium]|nr:acetyl-CoA synthetase [Candidatus Aminicenantes bacterium]
MKKIFTVLTICLLVSLFNWAGDNARVLRFPDVNKDLVVFIYAGDIWSVPTQGGQARRLTSHKGLELFPKISPDGQWIAFSGEYSGSRQVYVMPSTGGIPRQLTFYNDVGMMPPRGGFDYQIMDWTPDSKKILFRANRLPWGQRMGKFFVVDVEGGLEKPLQIPEAGGGTFSPDGTKIVYTPISREWRTWKRYKGGRAQDVWIYDLEKDLSQRLTTFTGTDVHPLWYKDKIYFVSDRDLTQNIYSYDLNTDQIGKVTEHSTYDILWPSGEDGSIAYENGGQIYVLDLEKEEAERVPVNLHFDNPNLFPYFKNVKEDIQGFDISPSGKRALFQARGEIFTLPAEQGITYNLSETPGQREIFPAWSPDGQFLAFYSDKTGEYEIYLMDKAENNEITQLTEGSRIWRFPLVWSPDSTKLLFSDKNQKLQILDVKTKEMILVDEARGFDITQYNWSPDSKWVAYTKDGDNGQPAVWVYSLDQAKVFQLTDNMYQDFSPVFSDDGKYLYFLSNRTFNLSFSSFEQDYLYNNATKIYAVPLTEEAEPLFEEKNDVEEIKKEKQDGGTEENKENKKEDTKAEIDLEGINNRIVSFPLPAGNYRGLAAVKGGILFLKSGGLHHFTISYKKDHVIMNGVRGYAWAAKAQKILYRARNAYGIIGLIPDQKPGAGELDFKDMEVKIHPMKEWKQMFADLWRIYRDWFYVENLHGVDWEKMKKKYSQLVSYLSHRADLDYLFGELVGELNVGHAYINWGEFDRPERVEGGLLGAMFEADPQAGRYIISKIYPGENWNENTRSPLTQQGIKINEGDYLLSINGRKVTLKDNPYQFLENTAGKKISLKVNSEPTENGAREYWVEPIQSELNLFYLDWVQSRREMVEKLSDGRIGYFHVPNTSIQGNRELFKGMYAYHHKEALIIDERYNGGGFIPDVMVDLLDREVLNFWARRGLKMSQTPGIAHDGPKVMLINHYSSSGGDAFPYYFKKLNLGLLVGTRTWGGLVGVSGNPGLMDGSSFSVPTFGFVNTQGEWAVEGIGVEPDIEVYDRPELIFKGKDPSLEKAVEILLEELENNPPEKPEKPESPDRSKWIKKKK